MPDMIPQLQAAIVALEDAQRRADSPTLSLQASQLASGLRIHVSWLENQHAEFDDSEVKAVKLHIHRMTEASSTGEFGRVLEHGIALMDALPGDPQTSQKWPRRD
jgi:hypothetical protein